MKWSVKRIALRSAKIVTITIASVVALLFLLPYLFPDTVAGKIKQWTNNSINGQVNFSKARLSFFRHFPSLTLTLYDFSLKGSAPYQNDTLLAGKELGLGLNLKTVFSHTISINKIFLTEGYINIQVSEKGEANYNVYVSKKTDSTKAAVADTSGAALQLEDIEIDKSSLTYNDRSLPLLINARDLRYSGSGDLSKAVFDLHTHAEIGSFDLYFNNEAYFLSKKINGDLVTKINTNSLALLFEKNDLKINQLPLQFNGRFEFLPKGYNMDFRLTTKDASLLDVFTVLPPAYATWLQHTEVSGQASIVASLIGAYEASTQKMPDLTFNMKVNEGSIAYEKSTIPINHLLLDFNSKLPSLTPDSLLVNIDSLHFNIGKDFCNAALHIKGMTTPSVTGHINALMDMENWDKALGLAAYDTKGKLQVNGTVNGQYKTGIQVSGLRKQDTATVITSIPNFNLTASLQNGYVKYNALPGAVENIGFNLRAVCNDHNYKHARLLVDSINATALQNYVKGFIHLGNDNGYTVDANLNAVLDLASIKQFYPLDSMELKGKTNINIQTKGSYIAAKKLFPVTNAAIRLNDGWVQTKYYPHPLTDIQVSANIRSSSSSLKSLNVAVQPISFNFEGQPFMLKADLHNFSDLRYNVFSKGVIDIGKIYQVFRVKGLDVSGTLKTDLSLKGQQSDAMSGNYDALSNKGTMRVKQVRIHSDYLPLPLLIEDGVFRFDQDKMWFDRFTARYGKSAFSLNGYLQNAIHYALQPNNTLIGKFDLKSKYILVDQLMAFSTAATTSGSQPAGGNNKGVILVPPGVSLVFTADATTVDYNGLQLSNVTGNIGIDSAAIHLQQTGFDLIGCHVSMDGSYSSVTPVKALFNYHLNAQNFDVKKAYQTIPLFHDLAPAAAKAEGIVSIDYQLKGRLNADMMPVYPSLEGGGTLTLQKVKMRGFKLFSAVSQNTGKNSINDPDLSKVNIKTTIKNNVINIEPVKMRVSGFRPKIQGQTTFDGRLNLKFRLGLPPFGIIGIPLTVTGTRDNPVVRVRRGSKDPALQETEDREEDDDDKKTP
ncbi:AsmA family protein [Deminuibacter soli]|uniref:AsmA family protein n=1 Tax=Deminuibacter soli TaxID=2291815 RepID=A0A3E1NRU3_9BACT|nr:AsmA-like C-terminal region-containing protein [Deminuibacter soli]RFM30564.1 AsmA family protein [Deminuibacter soli]